jgi:hypothetical protein
VLREDAMKGAADGDLRRVFWGFPGEFRRGDSG